MTTARLLRSALIGSVIAAIAGCSNETTADKNVGALTVARQAVTQAIAARRGGDEAAPSAPEPSVQERVAEALRVNSAPLILAGFENLGKDSIMAMTGQNGAKRTYMTPSEEALILRGGMLIGTRGLGNDLSVAEPRTEPLIRAGRSGSGQRIMRYYTGDGLETPLKFACDVGPGPKPGVTVETCKGHGISFQNSYIAQGGNIVVSRQWAGPALGYLTIQTLRP